MTWILDAIRSLNLREPAWLRGGVLVALPIIIGIVDVVRSSLDAGDSVWVALAAVALYVIRSIRRVVTPVADPRDNEGRRLVPGS